MLQNITRRAFRPRASAAAKALAFTLVITAALTLVITAVPGSSALPASAAPSGPLITIGWAPPGAAGAYSTATYYLNKVAAEARAAGINVKVETRAVTVQTDYALQESYIEDFVAQKVNAIVLSPIDEVAIVPAIQEANRAHIPVIYVNILGKIPGVKLTSEIGFNNAQASEVAAYAILNYFGGPGPLGTGPNVVHPSPTTRLDLGWWQHLYAATKFDKSKICASGGYIDGIAGNMYSVERLGGLTSVLKNYPCMHQVGVTEYTDWSRAEGETAAEDLLTRFPPSKMNFIWSSSNEMGIGSMIVLQRAGVLQIGGPSAPFQQGKKVAVFTQDNTPESTSDIQHGLIMGEVSHEFPLWGVIGIQFGVMSACHEYVPAEYNTDPSLVYKGNASQFYPNPALPPVNWQKIKASCKV